MISWHIEIGTQQSDSYWFPDFHYQELLLPYFGTGKIEVDEYGKTEYHGEELDRLLARLTYSYTYFEAKAISWEVIRTQCCHPGDNKNNPGSVDKFTFKRKIILQLLDNMIEMIAEAKASKGGLVFLGD